MLDTNTVGYVLRGRSPAARTRLLSLRKGESTCLSVITEAELRYGLAKRPEATTLAAAVELFLDKAEVLSWGRAEARAYGELRAKQEAAGSSLSNLDLLIAAHAVATGATLVTSDKAFGQISALRAVENWVTESAS